ncbi:MAG TPA: AraC family transcriptional regulator [Longimicrobium sp.]|nr:AraC family transcriptional regulator [Longimicrobium sp.]
MIRTSVATLAVTVPTVEEHWAGSGFRARTLRSRSEAVARVIGAMRERYAEPLTLESLARVAHCSAFHFNRVFHEVTGASPGQYLAAVRLEAAKRLLLTTGLSVAAVCFEVGYGSVGTFTTLFKRFVGVSPHRLRSIARETRPLLAALPAPRAAPDDGSPAPAGAHLRVEAPEGFAGAVFAGLFPAPIPRGRPVACAAASGPGVLEFTRVPDGRYYAFAVGVEGSGDPAELLLCARSPRGSAGPLAAAGGGLRGATLTLRPPGPADPPLLVALPCLLAERPAPAG